MHTDSSTSNLERVLSADQRAQLSRFLDEVRMSSSGAKIPEREDVPGSHEASGRDTAPTAEAPTSSHSLKAPNLGNDHPTSSDVNGRLLVVSSSPGATSAVATFVAQALGRELFTVEIARILSKFIAETEKRMEEVLDIAGEDGCVVLIDDADALFGIEASREKKFADQEIGYVLHHINSYNGVVIVGISAGTAVHPAAQEKFPSVLRC